MDFVHRFTSQSFQETSI